MSTLLDRPVRATRSDGKIPVALESGLELSLSRSVGVGHEGWRPRLGDCRVPCEIDDEKVEITALRPSDIAALDSPYDSGEGGRL